MFREDFRLHVLKRNKWGRVWGWNKGHRMSVSSGVCGIPASKGLVTPGKLRPESRQDLPKVEPGAGADLRSKAEVFLLFLAQVHHLPSPLTSLLCPYGTDLDFESQLWLCPLLSAFSGSHRGFFNLTSAAVLLTLMPRVGVRVEMRTRGGSTPRPLLSHWRSLSLRGLVHGVVGTPL